MSLFPAHFATANVLELVEKVQISNQKNEERLAELNK